MDFSAQATTPKRLGVELSWRLRAPYELALTALLLILGGVGTLRWQVGLKRAYGKVSVLYEEPYLPPGFVGNFFSHSDDRQDRTRETYLLDGWREFGPLVDGQETGEWSYRAPDGMVRGRFWKRNGQQTGPCEFWDATGTRRVSGRYVNGHRVGIWKLQNVIGDGTSFIWYWL